MSQLLVFTHQRWNFVRRRTQHLLGRMSRRFHVLVVETPVAHDGPPQLLRQRLTSRLDVLVPLLPASLAAGGFDGPALPVLRALLAEQVQAGQLTSSPVVWSTTPRAQPLLATLDPRAVVYDCVEDVDEAADATPAQVEMHRALLRRADLVFAGGPSLYERLRPLNRNVFCLPSAVDADRFAPHRLALDGPEHRAAAQLHAGMTGPRLGFYGVIDDRVDLGLVAALADARPDWQLVMAGPVEGLDPDVLPQRPNLHWLGRQPYDRLPYLLAQWDLALLPYAGGARTRCLNPTQALEYMAAEKPVVATALPDLRSMHADTMALAADRMAFVAACDELLGEPAAARQRRVTDMTYAAASMSWDRTAQAVVVLLSKALALHPVRPASTARRPLPVDRPRPAPHRERVRERVEGELAPAAAGEHDTAGARRPGREGPPGRDRRPPLPAPGSMPLPASEAAASEAAPSALAPRPARPLRPVRVNVPATHFALH